MKLLTRMKVSVIAAICALVADVAMAATGVNETVSALASDQSGSANQLYCGVVYSTSLSLYPSVTNVCSYPQMATTCQNDDNDGEMTGYHRTYRTWVYWGEMYFSAGTYRVASAFDDYVYMRVGNEVVLSGNDWWGEVTFKDFSISKSGWYPVEFRFVNCGYRAGDSIYHDGFGWVERKNLAIQKVTSNSMLADKNPQHFAIPGFDVNGNVVSGTFRLPRIGVQNGNIYVALTGSDVVGDGTEAKPFRSIQKAINVASDGDIVRVGRGVYSPVATNNKLIRVIGVEGAEATVIDGGKTSVCVDTRTDKNTDLYYTICTNTTFEGITLRNGRGVGGRTPDVSGGFGGTYRNCIVSNCVDGAGIRNAVVINCLVSGNVGINGANLCACLVYNSTIVGGYATDNGGGCYNCAVYNSIIYGNSSAWKWGSDNGQTYTTSSSYWGNTPAALKRCASANNCKTNPGFVNYAGGDYRLSSSSSCRDAGNNSYVSWDRDLDGNARIQNSRVDIGAYEYSGSSSPRKTISCSAMNVTATYDGKEHGIAVKISTRGNFTVQYAKSANGPWYSSLLVTDAGTETIYYRVSATGYETETGSATVMVLPRSVTLTSASASKKYDGTPLTARSVTVSGEGFVSGEGATFNVTGSQTVVGSSNNTFNYSLTGNTRSANYSIFKVEGTLTVSSKPTVPDPDDPDDPEPDDPEPDDPDPDDHELDPIFNTAQTFNGWLENDELAGTIQVKTTKAATNRKTGVVTAKATATVSVVGGKKQTFSGNLEIDEDGTYGYLEVEKNGRYLYIEMSSDGLYGDYSDDESMDYYEIQGMRDLFSSKNKDDKETASEVLNALKGEGSIMMAWMDDDGTGWNTFSVTINAKGGAKVSGTLADGTKVSVNATLIIGEDWCAIPVIYSKKNVSLAFNVWISRDTYEMSVSGLDEGDLIFGQTASFEEEACFCVDIWTFYDLLEDDGTFGDCSPDGVVITAKGSKWSLPKAGKVVLDRDGELDYDKLGDNPAGLKLTYKAKDGTFSGSFSFYQDKNGKPKATTVSVSGVMIDGIGYGTATLKKVGSVPVTIE